MINLSHKKALGAATFLITTILLISITMILIFIANYSVIQQKLGANTKRTQQAFEAAEAGLEFGINYLQRNSATILANKSGGFVQPYSDSSTNNVTLANGSKYTITYTNPTANNYSLIRITSIGVSDDSSATRTITQLVQFGAILFTLPQSPVVSKGAVSMNGSNVIQNLQGSTTIASGSTVSLSGSSSTQAQGGVISTPGHLQSDIQQNSANLTSQTSSDFFASYFGASMTTVRNSANFQYSGLSNYSPSLNGKQGVTIWIEQPTSTARLSGSAVIGSAAQPVLLIVNGNLDISGSMVLYGLIVVLGTTTTDVSGSSVINGGLLATDNLSLSGSNTITYNNTVLSTVQQSTTNYYAKVPGSWRDY
jgi:Tfp pilus assembly protein PilX